MGERSGKGEFQWSEADSVRSRNGGWQLEVHPVLTSDENESPVVLRQCATDRSKVVLILERSASVYFSSSGNEFIIINRPARSKYEILTGKSDYLLASEQHALNGSVGTLIYDAISKSLYPSRPVFFLPKLEKWQNGLMRFVIGGQAAVDGVQEISDYCFHVEYRVTDGNVNVKPAEAKDGMCVFNP